VLWQITTPVWQAAIDIPEWIWWDHLWRDLPVARIAVSTTQQGATDRQAPNPIEWE
jgi:hypothetical protein